MDRETANLIIKAFGGSITRANGHTTICNLSNLAEEVLDILDFNIERIELDEKINASMGSTRKADKETSDLMEESDTWHVIANYRSPTLDSEMASFIEDALADRPGAVVLSPEKGKWELWVKTGSEVPVFSRSVTRHEMQTQLPNPGQNGPLCAILVVGMEYLGWDFAWHDGTNWQSFQNGTITGLTREVLHAIELPGGEKWNP